MTTADWNGQPPATKSTTRRLRNGSVWVIRRVRPDGSVQIDGRRFLPRENPVTLPVPGEWLALATYERVGDVAYEWTAPADPDGFIRRIFWAVSR